MKLKMDRIKILGLSGVLLILLSTSCSKSTWEEQEKKQISDFLKTLGDTVVILKPSGLYYIELETGSGISPVDFDTVYFKYKAYFLDYVKWDENEPYSVPYKHVMGTRVGPVIEGIDEGLRYMKKGGTSKLITPSSLAYGQAGIWQIIPGYTPLLWFIELDSVKTGPGS